MELRRIKTCTGDKNKYLEKKEKKTRAEKENVKDEDWKALWRS